MSRARAPDAVTLNETREDAARAVGALLAAAATRTRGASIKARTLAPHVRHKRATHAVTCETIKHARTIKIVFADACEDLRALVDEDAGESEGKETFRRRGEAYVYAYETLFGNGRGLERWVGGEGCAIARENEEAMREALKREMTLRGVSSAKALSELVVEASEGASVRYSRTARVNTLKMTVKDALEVFRGDGFECDVDALIDTLLVFPAGTDLHAHRLVKSGGVVLQGRASCLPAAALAPERGWACIDGCAAPGNKTTQLAAMVGREGGVYAFDADAKRLKRLKENATTTGSHAIIRAKCQDFLTVDPANQQYASVRALLLDPSCSGSGTEVNRGDIMLREALCDDNDDENEVDAADHDRVEKLAAFQKKALTHAFNFPEVQRVSYSTCSVYEKENEEVVRDVMGAANERGFKLVHALPAWHRRGIAIDGLSESQARCLIRADPIEDDMEGFFVAVFERDLERTRSKGCELPPSNPNAAAAKAESERDKKKRSMKHATIAQPVYAKKKSKGGKPAPLFR